ncbi:hypothetical protein ACERII_24550 [Evansella sp. AB-rgal1]|uniref:hypothetical protein n=1 Tax=Evansella sp. AB-rgal1 TaxID=3242696 RepID=UPI00359DCB4F
MSNNFEGNDRRKIERLIAHDLEVIQPIREKNLERLEHVKPASVEAQIAFIKELVKSKEQSDAFIKDPKQYAIDHGVLLSPDVVQAITNAVIFDAALSEDLTKNLGPNALQDLIDMREGKPTGVHANAAAAAAAAAVVMAVVAVVTMVVTLVRTTQPSDLVSLQGLGKQGIKLPQGQNFKARDIVTPRINLGGLNGRFKR